MRGTSFHNTFSRSIHRPLTQWGNELNGAAQRYCDGLQTLSPTGTGDGHRGMYVQALRGKSAGLEIEQVINDIREHLDDSMRPVDDREIETSVQNAYNSMPTDPVPKATFDRSLFESLVTKGLGDKMISPITIPEVEKQSRFFIERMFRPEEYIVDGSTQAIRASTVRARLASTRPLGPHICINPFTGQYVLNENGNASYRRDQFVSRYTYALGEFDTFPDTHEKIPKEQQLAVWAASGLRIAALIDSGGKSIHAWTIVNCEDKKEWHQQVKMELFGKYLIPLGVDQACSNPSRLSRLPGVRRGDNWQRLIYLAGQEGGVL